MYEKELNVALECKRRGYRNILTCPNQKVRETSLKVMESSERISMRGVFIDKDKDGNFTIKTGLTTSKNILSSVFIPLTTQFNLTQERDALLNQIKNLEKTSGRNRYRMDMLSTIRDLLTSAEKSLLVIDGKNFFKKQATFKHELYYIYGVLAEKKIKAYHNKQNKLKKAS